jgi:N-acetylglucosaminyldiphosphoundecaprenol N-acetyl-beta-D-mannosaminyltransferase
MTYDPSLEKKLRCGVDFDRMLDAFRSGEQENNVAVGFVNPFSYPFVSQEARVRDGFDMWFVDGGLLCRLSNMFRLARLDRVSFDFSSVADNVFSLCNSMQLRVGLLGGTANELETARRYLEARYPHARFAFVENGFFPDEDMDARIHDMAAQNLQIAVIGLGTPKQERFVLRLKEQVQAPALLFTCGGFLSQTGVSGDYYPGWVKRTGLRWLYRALKHRHVRRRLLKDYPIFVARYLTSGAVRKLISEKSPKNCRPDATE